MQLVEQHCISSSDPRYCLIDEAAFKSKNLYNAALYELRQAFIHHGLYLPYEEMDTLMQPHQAYRALPAKVAQRVLKQLAEAWKAFREAQAAYADFQKINLEILSLSRRNTNVRSLALSLGKRRNATATCRDLLESVRDSIQDEGPKPSR